MLVQHYDARGLEQHIVEHTYILLRRLVEAVLEEAQLLREEERLHGVEGSDTLRNKSLQTSRPCGLLAEKLAKCDAIKCNADRRVPSQSKLTILEGSARKDLAPPPQKPCCVISLAWPVLGGLLSKDVVGQLPCSSVPPTLNSLYTAELSTIATVRISYPLSAVSLST
jgi:hypothetical protein